MEAGGDEAMVVVAVVDTAGNHPSSLLKLFFGGHGLAHGPPEALP